MYWYDREGTSRIGGSTVFSIVSLCSILSVLVPTYNLSRLHQQLCEGLCPPHSVIQVPLPNEREMSTANSIPLKDNSR